MQCKLILAFVATCLAVTVSAAPVAAAPAVVRVAELPVAREPEPAPVVEEARAPEPEPGCSLYTCIWYVVFFCSRGTDRSS
ncbi:hypothetical protein FB45DRAFT_1032434 [Roridomyces roridus]|uniref:Uncharacterized protein n=1 Tax=Roridomyces roridus TaxID=1738132 RepID=A0AAD7BHA4_9AGAR|nr:hypothetical protein FB45DRAFT_1032434 [Roridomyces roridus]